MSQANEDHHFKLNCYTGCFGATIRYKGFVNLSPALRISQQLFRSNAPRPRGVTRHVRDGSLRLVAGHAEVGQVGHDRTGRSCSLS